MTTPLMLPLEVGTIECGSCGEHVEESHDTVHGYRVCESCRDDEYFTCVHCDLLCNDGHMTTSGDVISERCTRRWDCDYSKCDDCDKYSRDLNSTYSGYVCEDCREGYWACEGGCGIVIPEGEGDYCADCDDTDRCPCGCGERTGGYDLIESYEYKPDPVFHGYGPLFLGVEIEISTSNMKAAAELAAEELGSVAYLKEDGSISNGFEIVTHPMTLDWASGNFPFGVLSGLKALGASASSECGIHVHVSRDAFDNPSHIYKWFKLFYRNEQHVTRVARRASNNWAAFGEYTRKQAKEYAKGNKNGERYQAINVQNEHTFELRIFASTLEETELRAAMELAEASVEYTRQITSREILERGAWSWFAFSTWVREHDKYAALASEIERVS